MIYLSNGWLFINYTLYTHINYIAEVKFVMLGLIKVYFILYLFIETMTQVIQTVSFIWS